MNGCPIEEYPVNKFTKHEKGFETDTFFQGRDSRTWMLDPEGYYIILEWFLCNHFKVFILYTVHVSSKTTSTVLEFIGQMKLN